VGRAALVVLGVVLFAGFTVLELAAFGHAVHSSRAAAVPPAPREVRVSIACPGEPAELERAVAAPLERALADVPGLERLRATARRGSVELRVQLAPGVERLGFRQEILERLVKAQALLPPACLLPKFEESDARAAVALELFLQSDFLPLAKVRELGEWVVAPKLETVPGVAGVVAWGGREAVTAVEVDANRLEAMGLSGASLVAALERSGATREALPEVVLAVKNGSPLKLSDVALVCDSARLLGSVTYNGKEGVAVRAVVSAGTDPTAVAERLRNELPAVQRALPAAVTCAVVDDASSALPLAREVELRAALLGAVLGFLLVLGTAPNVRAAAIVFVVAWIVVLAALGLGLVSTVVAAIVAGVLGGACELVLAIVAWLLTPRARRSFLVQVVLSAARVAAVAAVVVAVVARAVPAHTETAALFEQRLAALGLVSALAPFVLGSAVAFGFARLVAGSSLRWSLVALAQGVATGVALACLALATLAAPALSPRLETDALVGRLDFDDPAVSPAQASRLGSELASQLQKVPSVESVLIEREARDSSSLELVVRLTREHDPEAERQVSTAAARIPGFRSRWKPLSVARHEESRGEPWAGLELRVRAPSRDAIELALGNVEQALGRMPDVARKRVGVLVPERRVDVDRVALARFGLNVADVAAAMRLQGDGVPVDVNPPPAAGNGELVARNGPLLAVVVRFSGAEPDSLTTPDGARVPLSAVARITTEMTPSTLERESGLPVATLELWGDSVDPRVRDAIAQVTLPEGVSVEIEGHAAPSSRALADALAALGVGLAFVVLLAILSLRRK
jgi:cobalt-zinc-cadmium resistance protein CzcA